MKITAQQLRKIIAEEVKRATPKEELGYGTGSAELQTMLDVVCDGWKSQFDPEDPSIDTSGGKPAWDAQCDYACEVLGKKIEELMMQVEEALHRGDVITLVRFSVKKLRNS